MDVATVACSSTSAPEPWLMFAIIIWIVLAGFAFVGYRIITRRRKKTYRA